MGDWIKAAFFMALSVLIGAFALFVGLCIWIVVHGYDSSVGSESLSPWYEKEEVQDVPRPRTTPRPAQRSAPAVGPSDAGKARHGTVERRSGGSSCRPVTCVGAACYHNLDEGC